MQVRELEELSGLDRATIRFYEKEGLISPKRHENGYREYSQDDFNHLQKIKLLRRLGISLEQIHRLQQGRGVFDEILEEQINNLEAEALSSANAMEVCKQIRTTGVDYNSLDADHYLKILEKPTPNKLQSYTKSVPELDSKLLAPRHPIRKLLARILDYEIITTFLIFILFVVFRVRVANQFISFAINYGSWFLLVPISALFLSRFSMTPGKWLMGIRVLSCNGDRLSYYNAAEREWEVLHYGLGFGIPVWRLRRLYVSYKEYEQTGEMSWDIRSEIQYEPFRIAQKIAIPICLVILIGFNLWTANDLVKPYYRGSELTVSEFATNYNYTLSLLDADGLDKMYSDGSWGSTNDNSFAIYMVNEPFEPDKSFEYELNDGNIKKIRYKNTYSNVLLLRPMNNESMVAVMTLLLSQKEFSFGNGPKIFAQIEEMTEETRGSIQFENITVNWNSKAENCYFIAGTYNVSDSSKGSHVNIEIEIIINN